MSKTRNRQLRPLADRTTPHQQEKRALKIEARKMVAEILAHEIGINRGALRAFITLGFLARLRWLFTGTITPKSVEVRMPNPARHSS